MADIVPNKTTELRAPELGQTQKNVVGLNMFVCAQPSLIMHSDVTKQNNLNLL